MDDLNILRRLKNIENTLLDTSSRILPLTTDKWWKYKRPRFKKDRSLGRKLRAGFDIECTNPPKVKDKTLRKYGYRIANHFLGYERS